MASLSSLLLAAFLATSSATPFSPDSPKHHPQQRAPAIPAHLHADSPLDPNFRRSDKPTPPPIGFPAQPAKPTVTKTLNPGSGTGSSGTQPNIVIGDSPTQRSECTHTVTPDKVAGWPCPTGGTLSIYRSWQMSTKTVDCKGCGDVFISASTFYCPIDEVKTTEWIPTATTYTTFVCSSSKNGKRDEEGYDGPVETAAPELRRAEGEAKDKRQQITWSDGGGVVQIGCPTTFMIQPEQTAGVVWTEYRAWSTKTVGLLCGGCPLVTSTAKIGLGPAGRFKTTTTMPIGTTTAYKCQ